MPGSIVHSIAVDHIERRGLVDRPATAGAEVPWHPFAMRRVPAVLQRSATARL
jgi:hypothetical protein